MSGITVVEKFTLFGDNLSDDPDNTALQSVPWSVDIDVRTSGICFRVKAITNIAACFPGVNLVAGIIDIIAGIFLLKQSGATNLFGWACLGLGICEIALYPLVLLATILTIALQNRASIKSMFA